MANHEELVAEVKNLAAAPSVYSGLKDLAEQWLAAEGTAAQANLTALLRAALKEDAHCVLVLSHHRIHRCVVDKAFLR